MHRLIAPAVLQKISTHDIEQQTSPASRRMFFLVRHHVAGTHRPSAFTTALANAYAAQRGVSKALCLVKPCEVRCWSFRGVAGTQTQVFVDAVRIYRLDRIHL